MKNFNILITGAGSTTAMTVLKGIRLMNDRSILVFMGDPVPDCAGAYLGDKFIHMPLADDPDFEKIAIEICKRHRIDLVIPNIDYEFKSWSRIYEEPISVGTRVIISNSRVITLCEEKDKTIQYFNEINVPCPTTWRIDQIRDPDKLPFPVFIKPRCGRASLDTHRVNTVEEYLLNASKKGDMIVQPCILGDEITIDTISDFDGHLLGACLRKRLEIKSGQAYKSLTIDSPELVDYAKKIVEGLPIIGPANIQCFITNSGPQFFEINPRFGAGTILSIKAGLNSVEALVNMARKNPIPELKPRPKVWMLRYWQEVFIERDGYPIFFDLDGPILDVSQRHYTVYRSILEEANKSVLPFERYWQSKRARQPHRRIVSETAGKDFYDKFTQLWFNRIENERYLALDRVWPWAIDVLSELYQNHDLYVVTVRSNPEQLRSQMVRLNLNRWFQAILCRPSRQNAAKEKVNAIREHFNTLPKKAIIVGDTEADIECGKELGFITVGVECGIRNKEQLLASNCDFLLENIQSLPQLIYNLPGQKKNVVE